MRFLLDENQSPVIANMLADAGHDAVHVRDIGLSGASDAEVMQRAEQERRVVLSGDTDFGELLARTNASSPSILLLRRQRQRRAAEIAQLILANLDGLHDDLDAGAIAVLEEQRVRIRRLPLRPATED